MFKKANKSNTKFKVKDLCFGSIVYDTGKEGLYYSCPKIFKENGTKYYDVVTGSNYNLYNEKNNDFVSVTGIHKFNDVFSKMELPEDEISLKKANLFLIKFKLLVKKQEKAIYKKFDEARKENGYGRIM